MAHNPKHDVLFEPIQIGPKTMKNRFYQIPHCNGFGSERPLSQAYFRAMKAEGGYAACCTEYCSHSYLPQQFLTPYYNHRTDEYGGSLENRARFWRETIEQVKDAVGHDCAIAVRISADMFIGEAGTQLERDVLPFVQIVDHLVDVWDVNVSGISEWGEDATPSRFYPQGRLLPWQAAVKSVSKKPVLGVGRWTNPDAMADAINAGKLDIIATCRPSISDPFLPKKIDEGRLDDIRECIGCNICISRWEIGGPPLICTHNATAGEEYRRGWHPERFEPAANAENDVVGLDAGPAGMECAMVLGKRGMRRVHLVDANDDMGGIMRWIPQLPGLGEWARVVNYRKIQIDKLPNVELIPGTTLDANAVKEYGAEIVVIATGANWVRDGLNGCTHDTIPGADASQPWCLTPEQIMRDGKEVPGSRVLIVDNDGYFMGVSLAEKLADEGKKVTLMTHLGHIAPYMHFTLEAPNQHRKLHRPGADLVTYHSPSRIEHGSV